MLSVEIRRVLIGFRNRQNVRLVEQVANETNARWGSCFRKTVGQDYTRVARQIAQQETFAALRGREKKIHPLKGFCGLLNYQVTDALCLEILHRRNEAFFAK